MKIFLLVIGSALLALASSQNPTTICYTPLFTAKYYNLLTEDQGAIYVSFAKEIYTEISSSTGLKIIRDFKNLKHYAVSGSTCKVSVLPQSHVITQCLPPYSKIVSSLTGAIGYSTNYKLPVQTWEVETDYDLLYRISLTLHTGSFYFPVLSQELGYHGSQNLYLYNNHAVSITNQTVFEVPASCANSSQLSSPQLPS